MLKTWLGFSHLKAMMNSQALLPHREMDRPGLNSGKAKALGSGQIACGALTIFLSFLVIAIPAQGNFKFSASYIACANLCGTMFIMPGVFGVASSKSKSNCAIIATMVLSILAVSLFWPIIFSFALSEIYSAQEEGLHVAINSVLLLVLLVEFVVAIFQATVCCKAVCSCCKPYDEEEVHIQYRPGGQKVVILTPTGPQEVLEATTNTGQTVYIAQSAFSSGYHGGHHRSSSKKSAGVAGSRKGAGGHHHSGKYGHHQVSSSYGLQVSGQYDQRYGPLAPPGGGIHNNGHPPSTQYQTMDNKWHAAPQEPPPYDTIDLGQWGTGRLPTKK